MLNKILIANRGEIAVRVIRACRLLKIKTVAIYSEIDSSSLHVKMADEAFCLGNGSVQETYLNIDKIISFALKSKANGIHPGYGFLSENANFAKEVEKQGMIFIGPTSSVLYKIGNKLEAKKMAEDVGIQVIPGSSNIIESVSEAEKLAEILGYPIIIKAVFGGGGIGIEIVERPEDLEKSLTGCQSIAKKYFGNNAVFLESYIREPRHIEMQFMSDNHGAIVQLGDRECSIQRSHQKIIEEAPSFISSEKRNDLGEKICMLAKNLSYNNIGTVEFLWKDDELFFNEINPRIQVEHPITEMITGIDLVIQQLRIANNEELQFDQSDIKFEGHAFEFRINAEDPLKGLYPQMGRISNLSIPENNNVRFDTFIYPNYQVPNQYDSLIGKLIVKGRNREETIQKSLIALKELSISGIKTNIDLHKAIIQTHEFLNREITSDFLNENKINQLMNQYQKLKLIAMLKAKTAHNSKQKNKEQKLSKIKKEKSKWREQSRLEQQRR